MNLKLQVINLLYSLFFDQKDSDVESYESVDEFYSDLGYEFESEDLLHEIGVHSTSGLQELLTDYGAYLEMKMTSDEFKSKWLSK